jgi:hypothetical protein
VATSPLSVPADQRNVLYASMLMAGLVMAVFAGCIATANRRFHATVVLVIAAMELVDIISWVVGTRGQA